MILIRQNVYNMEGHYLLISRKYINNNDSKNIHDNKYMGSYEAEKF